MCVLVATVAATVTVSAATLVTTMIVTATCVFVLMKFLEMFVSFQCYRLRTLHCLVFSFVAVEAVLF